MKLYVNCKNCRAKIRVKSLASDRAELVREKGGEFMLQCNGCSNENRYHTNDVMARESKSIAVIALVIFFFGTGAIAYLLRNHLFMLHNPYNILAIGGVLLIPSIVFMLLTKQERDNTRRFNRYWPTY